jgi:hypothetical protein
MRRVLILAVLALALPLMAYADSSIDLTNRGVTITGNAAGLSLTGSTLISFGSAVGSNLGSVTFTTGAFTSGNAQMGGTIAAGGSFTITGNGTNGVPNGVIFSGTFSGPVTWTATPLANGTHSYTLSGAIADASGQVGATVQLTGNLWQGLFQRVPSAFRARRHQPECAGAGNLGPARNRARGNRRLNASEILDKVTQPELKSPVAHGAFFFASKCLLISAG